MTTANTKANSTAKKRVRGEFVPAIGLVPGNSFFHKLHAGPKMMLALAFIMLAFLMRNVNVLLGMALLGCVLVALSGTWSSFFKSMLVISSVLFAMIFFQSVAPAYPQPWTPVTRLGPLTIYQEGIYSGLVFTARIIVGSAFGLLVILTTHPADIFLVFRSLGVPYELSFMTLTTLQLIPILQREFIIVMSAQQSRGLKAQGFGALLPSIVPVFAGSIERVQQLAMSLESRAFGSSGKKTSLRENRARPLDHVMGILGILLLVGSIVFVIVVGNLDTSEAASYPTWLALTLTIGSFVGFIGLVARFIFSVRA
jgi:energy-coupling factor transport system permease protein